MNKGDLCGGAKPRQSLQWDAARGFAADSAPVSETGGSGPGAAFCPGGFAAGGHMEAGGPMEIEQAGAVIETAISFDAILETSFSRLEEKQAGIFLRRISGMEKQLAELEESLMKCLRARD